MSGLEAFDYTQYEPPPWELGQPAEPRAEPLEEGEAVRIAEAVKNEAHYDHARYPEGFWVLWGVMRSIAEPGGSRDWAQQEAIRVLRRIQRRVLDGEEQIEVNRRGA